MITPETASMPASFVRLELLIGAIEREFGGGAIKRLSAQFRERSPEVISTGLLSLDRATGRGGVPRGRVTEIFGGEGSGKTSLALHLIAEAQAGGGICAFIDAEHALCPEYVGALGVRVADLYVAQPDSGEQAVEIVEALLRSGCFDIIALDSVAALAPRAELNGRALFDPPGATHARLVARALRKLCGLAHRSHTALVFTNQLRDRINRQGGATTTVTTGGRSLAFRASLRLETTAVRVLWDERTRRASGTRVRVRVVKNKMWAPGATGEFDLTFAGGVSKAGDLFDTALRDGVIERVGDWFTHRGVKLAVGRGKLLEAIETDRELRRRIEAEIRGRRIA